MVKNRFMNKLTNIVILSAMALNSCFALSPKQKALSPEETRSQIVAKTFSDCGLQNKAPLLNPYADPAYDSIIETIKLIQLNKSVNLVFKKENEATTALQELKFESQRRENGEPNAIVFKTKLSYASSESKISISMNVYDFKPFATISNNDFATISIESSEERVEFKIQDLKFLQEFADNSIELQYTHHDFPDPIYLRRPITIEETACEFDSFQKMLSQIK